MNGLGSQAVRGEVDKVLEKSEVEIVDYRVPAFYSRLFLVEKASGGWRPIIDLSPLDACMTF